MIEKVTVLVGDITRQEVDAIVNSAHPSFCSGGGSAGGYSGCGD